MDTPQTNGDLQGTCVQIKKRRDQGKCRDSKIQGQGEEEEQGRRSERSGLGDGKQCREPNGDMLQGGFINCAKLSSRSSQKRLEHPQLEALVRWK